MDQICFTQTDLLLYVTLLICIVVFLVYALNADGKEHMASIDLTSTLTLAELRIAVKQLRQQLYEAQLNTQRCNTELAKCTTQQTQQAPAQTYINKIANPLVSPDRIYVSPNSRMDNGGAYQMVGFVFKDDERYPLFGRYKFPGRSDRWEYYIMDETRNKLKIPVKTRNDNELYTGDTIDIPAVGAGYNVNIYEIQELRYNPNVF